MYLTAKEQGLAVCPKCHQLNEISNSFSECLHCRRCNAVFYPRKPKSLQHCFAWTVVALVMFIPANLYPMMIFYQFGVGKESTILEGIFLFVQSGMLPIALIIFIASFVVPLGKIVSLFILMNAVVTQSQFDPKKQAKLYHFVEFLGPWSMLDVFVVAVMAAVVKLGFITFIEVGVGISYFALMAVSTMIAAESFDPRLIWDNHRNEE